MIKCFLSLPWFIWAAAALMVAVIYSFVWPRKAVSTGFRFCVLRWGHALVWVLLAFNFVLRGISPSLNDAANWVALVGGILYSLFIIMIFAVRSQHVHTGKPNQTKT